MNKKAVVGKALTFHIFILLIFIIALFLLSAGIMSSLNSPKMSQASLAQDPSQNLLLQEIQIKLAQDQQPRNILVLDALALRFTFQEGIITEPILQPKPFIQALENLEKSKGQCYHLSYPSFTHSSNKELFSLNTFNITKTTILIDNKEIEIEYYFGKCP